MTDELKPCPFCGGEAKIRTATICLGDSDADVDWLKVICSKCGASEGFSRFRNHDPRSADFLRAKLEAITAWNTRAEDTGLQQRVRELEEAAHMAMLELGSHGACPACFNAHSTLRNALTKPEGLK